MAMKLQNLDAHVRPRTQSGEEAIDLPKLRHHLRTLIALEETSAPVLSCYVNIEAGLLARRQEFDGRVRVLRKSLACEERDDFEYALGAIERFLASGLAPGSKGAAVFARTGSSPFFLPLQFRVPVASRLLVDTVPIIYPLVELKDSYHRFVVMISTEESARILEVSLGAITRELWEERPELRDRAGREWTRQHYQARRRNRDDRFLREKIAILEKLMSAAGHTHLILAGSPRMTARVRNSLPNHLATKLIDIVPASSAAQTRDVVAATLSSFIEREQQESLSTVERLVNELRRGGLAFAGTGATLEALERKQVDVLVMAKDYDPPAGLACKCCGRLDEELLATCFRCGSTDLRPVNVKEAMVKQTEGLRAVVEFVEHSDVLMELGGVGCLLRYATSEPNRRA